MNRLSDRSAGSIVALALGAWVLFMGLHSVAEASSTLTFEQPVHFLASDGTDVQVGIGTHEVETLVGSRLRLNMEGGETVLLDAQATTHSEEIEAPLAVTVSGDDPDLVHLVLLLPNGQALDAPGSISGTRSRGFSSFFASTTQIQLAVAKSQPTVRDHRKPKRGTPPPTTSPTQTAPTITQPSVGDLTNNLLALEDRYVAPTPGLTLIANAIKLQSKSLTSVLVMPPGLRLSTPVDISVEYLSPASPRQIITQAYGAETGNRFVRQDLEGDGKLRRQFMTITLTERTANGAGAQFTLNWQVDLDPLFNVEVSSLRFKLLNDCDWVGKSEIQLAWVRPDKSFGTWNFSRRKGQLVTVSDFAWSGRAISAKSGLVQPYAIFKESDPCLTMDCVFGLQRPFSPERDLPPLVPGRTEAVTVIKTPKEGGSCRAEITYPIVYALYVDPVFSQPTTPPIVLDNQAPSVQRVGTWCPSNATVGVYGPDSEWSCNGNTGVRFRWVPTIPATGQYDVYVRWPNHSNRSKTVPYTVHHAGGNAVKVFNQQTDGNNWRLHGRYILNAGTETFVEVGSANGTAGADAVQFVRVP